MYLASGRPPPPGLVEDPQMLAKMRELVRLPSSCSTRQEKKESLQENIMDVTQQETSLRSQREATAFDDSARSQKTQLETPLLPAATPLSPPPSALSHTQKGLLFLL